MQGSQCLQGGRGCSWLSKVTSGNGAILGDNCNLGPQDASRSSPGGPEPDFWLCYTPLSLLQTHSAEETPVWAELLLRGRGVNRR